MKNDILVVIDGSYWLYYTIFGSVSRYMNNHKLEAETLIKPADETDQNNLPNLLISDSFKSELKKNLISRCETVDYILKNNFQDEIDLAENIDILFVQDDRVSNSFRRQLYPEYKAGRSSMKRSYDIGAIRNYIMDVLFPELNITQQFNFRPVWVEGAEGDDVAAVIMKNFNEYMLKVLIASDHDFQQIEGIHQFDMKGNEIKTKVSIKHEDIILTPKEALIMKILVGDGADNIPSIAERMGSVTAYKLIKDKDKLKKLLTENQDAAKQYMLNRSIIDFDKIPAELTQKIIESASKILSEGKTKNKIHSSQPFILEDL